MRSVVEIGASVPAFLAKLWKLVNDSETNHLISWTPGGKTFVIKNQADFARELLPLSFKHNNMASFVRQLNMYGFHKITSVENGGLRFEKDEIEFSHACFMRGHAYLLEHIKRKIANPKAIVASTENGEKLLIKPEMMNKVLTDVKQMKGKQESLDAKFSAMKQENEALWREVAILRQKHIKQQQIVNNLIQFLMSLVQPTRPGSNTSNNVGVKRPYQLMINSAAHNTENECSSKKNAKRNDDPLLEELIEDNLEDGPTIHELVHDDLHQGETSQDALNTNNLIEIDVSPSPFMNAGPSPADSHVSSQYHVTMDDADDGIELAPPTQPSNVLAAPSTSQGKSKHGANQFGQAPDADLLLPADIFASDDSVSDAGILQNINPVENDTLLSSAISSSRDTMLGGINIKIEKPEETKAKKKKGSKSQANLLENGNFKLDSIKTELQDDLDWNVMTLATVNNNTDMNKYPSVKNRGQLYKNLEELSSLCGISNKKPSDIDDHLDSMQTDLDSLRELLRSDSYALDANTLLGLFGTDDPLYGLPFNAIDDRSKTTNNAKKQKGGLTNISGDDTRVLDLYCDVDAEGTNQLMSYTGKIPDFGDIQLPELENSQEEACLSPGIDEEPSLNTPLVTTRSPAPSFPTRR